MADGSEEIARQGRSEQGALRASLDGIALISAERQRQRSEEGWTQAHDDLHTGAELADAAACYATRDELRNKKRSGVPADWPWDAVWWKPTPNNRVRELTKAGALIAAEIDRLLRVGRDEASGTAPQAPPGPSESAPPAPDLLRENARLSTELASEKRYTLAEEERRKLAGDALQAEGDAHALREELTRARAAHLENAELLAKAHGALREALEWIEGHPPDCQCESGEVESATCPHYSYGDLVRRICSLLNQGRDEVATSPEITREGGAPRRSPTDTEPK